MIILTQCYKSQFSYPKYNHNQLLTMSKALIIVDPQNDFCEGGPLGVKDSKLIFQPINALKKSKFFQHVFITKDWHPVNHISFADTHQRKPFDQMQLEMNGKIVTQVLWPKHCIQNTVGAQLSNSLSICERDHVILKGYRDYQEVYSGFGTQANPTQMGIILKNKEIKEVYVVGLALDYCVGLTALDSQKVGFKTWIVEEGTKGIAQNTIEQMKNRLKQAGVCFISKEKLI